jgi:hypothetical protein
LGIDDHNPLLDTVNANSETPLLTAMNQYNESPMIIAVMRGLTDVFRSC